ncbi:sn-glycerol-3-phosphate ABC transporter ATP-binding protein UgpC [Nocardioides endophyticus]|uniref:Sn-glycerol-3-phosphate ABC transporter ATP-binding protein UgpC n=1 Tax=Nocardioides endophyticus TaxID=1353775 RepID=A0ABP8Z0P5_9ACTN
MTINDPTPAESAMTSGATLELVGVTKAFGDFVAVQDVSFVVKPGSLVALLGPSGCGKTTMLRMIVGLETPSSGSVLFDARDVSALGPGERGAGLVFQDYAIFPHLTVSENLGFALKMRGDSPAEQQEVVKELAAALELTALLKKKPRSLNPSELQRVSIGRALAARPAIMLFDEPLSNVEAGMRTRMRAELRTLHKAFGQTAVYVTHDQTEAMALADRVAVMNRGRLVQFGAPRELYDRPADAFVAGFIGTPPMNLLDVEATEGRAYAGSLSVPIPQGLRRGDARWQLGFRPEHTRLSLAPDHNEVARGQVVAIEPMGAEVTVTVAGKGWQVAALLDEADRADLTEDASVSVVVDASHLHWFHPDGPRDFAADTRAQEGAVAH